MCEMIINIELLFGYLALQLKSKDQTGIPNHERKSAKQNDFMILMTWSSWDPFRLGRLRRLRGWALVLPKFFNDRGPNLHLSMTQGAKQQPRYRQKPRMRAQPAKSS